MKKEQKENFDWQVFWRILSLAKPYRLLFILAAVLTLVLAPLRVLRPRLINLMVDEHIVVFNLEGMNRLIFWYLVVLIAATICQYLFIYLTNVLGQSVIRDLRIRVFKHITSMRLRYFDQTAIGTNTTRTISDVESVNQMFTQGIITMISDILGIIAVLIMMFSTSWRLTLICLVTMPMLMIATYIFKERIKASYQMVRNELSRMNAFLQERISGMRIIQIFNAEKQELKKFQEINSSYTKAYLKSIFAYAVFFPVVEIISALSLALMVWWGARGILAEDVTLGALVVFPIYLSMLFRPIRMLADKFNTLQMGLVAADRIFLLLDQDDTITNAGEKIPDGLDGKIEFRGVSFAYDEINYVVQDISFELKAGQAVAIVGGTGSGKTTIINLLNRFYENQKGSILVDDVDIRQYELEAYRKEIAMVLQDVFLFGGTVLENIRLRDQSISREAVIEASRLIGAHEFIEKLPGGYDFVVTERGNNLSMGQRQLISFVRALVFDPHILILDEATSSIDTETEAVIQNAIETLIAKRSSIIIAHRLSTIRHADKIIVMQNGRIQEMGSHDELINLADGYYKKLYETQFEGV